LFDSKLDHNSALHAKIREKSLVIESKIEFPEKMSEKCGKNYFSLPQFLIKKYISKNKVRRYSEYNLKSDSLENIEINKLNKLNRIE